MTATNFATALVPEASALTPADWARRYTEDHGFALTWIRPGSKRPGPDEGWPNLAFPPEYWDGHPQCGMGLLLDNGPRKYCSLDLDDVPMTRLVFASLDLNWEEMTAHSVASQGNPERFRVLFLAPEGGLRTQQLAWPHSSGEILPNGQRKMQTIFELRGGHGFQDVLPPSIHPNGQAYAWLPGRAPWETDILPMPAILEDLWKHWADWKGELEALCPWEDAPIFSEKPLRGRARGEKTTGVISAWNDAHSVGEILRHHGYVQKNERRWLAPGSSTGLPGVSLLKNGKVYSHHGSDPLNDGQGPKDAFDAFRILEHDGKIAAAVKAAANILRIPRTPPQPGPGETYGADLRARTQDGQAGEVHPQHGAHDTQGSGREGGQARQAMPATPAPAWLTPVGELLTEPPPMGWLVKGILPPDTLAMLFGDPQAGKSLLAVEWACHIAMGKPWLGKRVTQGPVIIIAGEGHHGIRRRLKGWAGAHDCEADLAAAKLFVSRTGTRMIDPAAFQEVIAEIDAVKAVHGDPALVLVDTLHRNLGGVENDEQDIGLYVRALDTLRERYGTTILTVHHSGHTDKGRGRGSSALGGDHDVIYAFSTDLNGTRTLTPTKTKDLEPPPPLSFALKQVVLPWRDEDGDNLTTVILEPVDVVAAPRQRTAPASVKLAMDTLIASIDAVGDPLPEVPNGPDPSPPLVVPLAVWRDAFYDRHHGDTTDAKKRAFSRARGDLVAGRAVGCWQDLFWPGLAGDTQWDDINGQILARGSLKNPTTK